MAVNLPDVHRRALHATGSIVAVIRVDQWTAPTPCDGWDARELLNHIVTGNWWAEALTGGQTIEEVGDRLDGDVLGDDPASSYERSASAADAAFSAPGAMEAPCAVSYGPVPGSIYCGHRFIDVLIHGWDLAQATGQDIMLDPELVDACRQVLEPQQAMLEASGMFGTTVPVPDDADPETRLLATLGRTREPATSWNLYE